MESEARDFDSYPRLDPDDTDAGGEASAGADPGAFGAPEAGVKADLGKRIVAAVIDAVAAVAVSFIPVVGGLLSTGYWLVRDGLDIEFMDRRSLGKKLTKLRPVRVDGLPMDIETSLKRNWMFAIGGLVTLLLFIPILGWLMIPLVILAAVVIAVVEIYLTVTDPEGRRFGDKFAGTKVIEVED
ncbi:MAG: RDD family protein [Longimicrobiales bacterium]